MCRGKGRPRHASEVGDEEGEWGVGVEEVAVLWRQGVVSRVSDERLVGLLWRLCAAKSMWLSRILKAQGYEVRGTVRKVE
jgi:hypothetical protein